MIVSVVGLMINCYCCLKDCAQPYRVSHDIRAIANSSGKSTTVIMIIAVAVGDCCYYWVCYYLSLFRGTSCPTVSKRSYCPSSG